MAAAHQTGYHITMDTSDQLKLFIHIGERHMTRTLGKLFACSLLVVGMAMPAIADDFKDCTKEPKDKWKAQTEAEAAAKTAGYEVRKSKIEGTCYEVYGVDKAGKLFELFYNPIDLKLVKTIAK